VTIPKKVRDALDLDDEDFVEFARVGNTILLRKLQARRDKVQAIREKIRRSGLTRTRVEALVRETRKEMWRRRRR